jgi:ribonuclease HI
VTITEHAALVRRFAEDFTALQEAVLARMNGISSEETAAALEHASLADPIAIALAHADVLARGDVRRAELSGRPAERLRRLREHARKVRRARSRADAVCKEQRARRTAGLSRPVETLELRVVRAAYPQAYATALREELRDRGVPESTPRVPESDLAQWAWDRQAAGGEPPAPVRALLDHSDDAFVQALLRDAREEENPHLLHDAVVGRWNRHARSALAWGRYAIARAERDVLTRPLTARHAQLDALDDAYQDTAVLAARAREARLRAADLHDRMRACAVAAPVAELVARCRAAALVRFAAAEPESWHGVRELTAGHRADCAERAGGCPHCHHALAAALTGTGEDGDGEDPAAAPADRDRYALLDDLPDTAVVAVADAAVGDESALCGHGWAAEDGTTGHGDSMASNSGEAEVIGICAAALSLLERHGEAPVVVLCDSVQAVKVTNAALERADPAAAHRTLLFPEGRDLMDRLLRHRDRVQVRWLKGHVGHDLNETADALAGLSLRRATGRVSPLAARKEEARILRSLGSGNRPSSAAA